jgi:very-short-patch-repair endonuclease
LTNEAKISHARHLRKNLTDAEQKLWRHIRNRQIKGFRFRRQAPIGNYIVDFVCFEKKLIIELDGGQHSEQQEYDHHRSLWLKSKGYTVIRFWNNDVLNNIEGIMEVILKKIIPPSQPSPARGEGVIV